MRYAPEKAQPYLFHQLTQLFKALLLIVGVLMLARFMFIGQNSELVVLKKNLPLTLEALFLGLRYDLICAAYVLAIPYVVTCVGFLFPQEGYLRFIPWFHRVWIFVLLALLLVVAMADLSFFSYFQDHINVVFLSLLRDDGKTLLASLHKQHNLFIWAPVFVGCLGLVAWVLARWFKRERIDLFYSQPMAREELSMILTAGVVVLVFLARGNFGRFPLSIEDSYISDISSINELSVNGVIALNRAFRIERSTLNEDVRYLAREGYQQLSTAIADVKTYRQDAAPQQGWTGLEDLIQTVPVAAAPRETQPHVVVLVVRNFASLWWDEALPVLGGFKKHADEDILFQNFITSANGTIGIIDALTSGLPPRPGARSLSESEYMRTQIASGSHLPFKRAGYTTRFLYGGKLGWRQLGQYLNVQGWDQLEGPEQVFEKQNLYDLKEADRASELGVYDEHLFAYLKRELETATAPQFFFVLTTTSQPPFELPLSHKPQGLNRLTPDEKKSFGRDSDDVLALAKGLQYSLGHLSSFIDGVKSGALKENLALAVTGDHAYWVGRNRGDENLVQRLGVPFYLYLPADLKPQSWNKENWGSHVDILPTLFEATLPGKAYWGFGQSMFKARGAGLNAQNIAVSDVGAWVGGRAKCWTSETEKTLVDCTPTEELEALLHFNRAQMGLADEFLRTQASGQIGLLP